MQQGQSKATLRTIRPSSILNENASKETVKLKTTNARPWEKEKVGSTTQRSQPVFGGVKLKKTATLPTATKPIAVRKSNHEGAVKLKKAKSDSTNKTIVQPKPKVPKQTKSALDRKSKAVEAPEDVLLEAVRNKLKDKSLEATAKKLIDRIKIAGGFPQRKRLSLRDNELVSTMERAILNDPSVIEINVDSDPRFAHIQKSLLLDFAEGLRTNMYLKTLSIRGVELGNGFLSALSTSIESNFTLEKVILSNNSFTSDALVEFCQALGENESIRHVDLRCQHSPVFGTAEEIVLEAIQNNHTIEKFHIDFKTKSMEKAIVRQIVEGRQAQADIDKKLLEHLEKEANRAEQLFEHRQQEVKVLEVTDDDDWDYLFKLNALAQTYKVADTEPEKANQHTEFNSLPSFQVRQQSAKQIIGMTVNYTADGSFLTNDFISSYLVEDKECGSLTFAFQTQSKMFKRFPIGDTKRRYISEKFADVLLDHPRSNQIAGINMANSACGDEWLVRLCERSLKDPRLLPNLHSLNLETNYIAEAGIVMLSKCLAASDTWKYLQVLKLENQRHLISSKAELALTKALCINRSVIHFSLRVRNLWERGQCNKFVSRNMDFLRQARLKHAIKTGTQVKRARNPMEALFDSIATNDPSITKVEIMGDQIFLSLPTVERQQAAKAFASNTHVKSIKMTGLRLDDAFACELARSLRSNSSIENLCLDSNKIGSEGIEAIISSLSNNASVEEVQLRHQSTPLRTTEEEALAGLLENNKTLCKLGVDLRSIKAQNDLDRLLNRNRELRRVARQQKNTGKPSPAPRIKATGKMQQYFKKIADNDPTITQVSLVGDKLFLAMKPDDRIASAMSFQSNTHVKSIKLSMLDLDDSFACALADSLRTNKSIEKLDLDSNAIGKDGIKAIFSALSNNHSLAELQIRHQKKPLASADEEALPVLLGNNETIVKLGVDLRSPMAQREIDSKLTKNREQARKRRVAAKKP